MSGWGVRVVEESGRVLYERLPVRGWVRADAIDRVLLWRRVEGAGRRFDALRVEGSHVVMTVGAVGSGWRRT